jgi:antitoxin HigA-1
MARPRCLRRGSSGLSLTTLANLQLGLPEEAVSIARKGTANWGVHPGEILREEFLKPMGVSAYEVAKRIHVPAPRINDIVLEKRGITADTALRLSRLFRTTAQFWLNLQDAYEISRIKAERTTELEKIVPLSISAARF